MQEKNLSKNLNGDQIRINVSHGNINELLTILARVEQNKKNTLKWMQCNRLNCSHSYIYRLKWFQIEIYVSKTKLYFSFKFFVSIKSTAYIHLNQIKYKYFVYLVAFICLFIVLIALLSANINRTYLHKIYMCIRINQINQWTEFETKWNKKEKKKRICIKIMASSNRCPSILRGFSFTLCFIYYWLFL